MDGDQVVKAALFWLFLISAVVIIAVSGGNEGRRFLSVLVAAVIATFLANAFIGFVAAQPLILAIDIGLLIYVVALALDSRSHWPLWFAGFHMITVATGLAMLASPTGVPELYVDGAAFWALPALCAAVVGVILDRRAALVR
jgi:hypothetical protein